MSYKLHMERARAHKWVSRPQSLTPFIYKKPPPPHAVFGKWRNRERLTNFYLNTKVGDHSPVKKKMKYTSDNQIGWHYLVSGGEVYPQRILFQLQVTLNLFPPIQDPAFVWLLNQSSKDLGTCQATSKSKARLYLWEGPFLWIGTSMQQLLFMWSRQQVFVPVQHKAYDAFTHVDVTVRKISNNFCFLCLANHCTLTEKDKR